MSIAKILDAPSFSPAFHQLLTKRGLIEPAQIEKFLAGSLDDLEDPFSMRGVKEACARIQTAVKTGQKILIHGDYDVDGVTGAAIIAKTLEHLKADWQSFLPDRVQDGYGVSESAIRRGAQKGVKLLITVDCGITATEEIRVARELGMDCIVIDHHRIPPSGLPPATEILNPLQANCPYPFKELSAGGLAFKLSQALVGKPAYDLLDLAALSTVCDVAPLAGENRIIVRYGLKKLTERTRPGLKALTEIAAIKSREINAGHIGFVLGPRINAAGRMSSPDTAFRLLTTENEKEAASLAQVLHAENKERQREERRATQEAIRLVERTVNFNRERILVVASDSWHPGVVGIVASRLVGKFYRPAIVISLKNGLGKGSGRSIPGFHLFNAMESCKELFEEFGGHEQAAGLSIREEVIADLRRKINEFTIQNTAPEVFEKKINWDLEIPFSVFRGPFVEELKLLEPHGAGNPRPVFLTRRVKVKGAPKFLPYGGAEFRLSDGAMTFEALLPDEDPAVLKFLAEDQFLDLIYTVKTRSLNGIDGICLEIKSIRASS